MIGHLRGRLGDKQPDRIVVDVNGVGYELHVPLSTFYVLGEQGAEVSLRVHTHVREDTLALFGFATPLELRIFERLIAVGGVGPRLALAVLSGIEPPDFVRAVKHGDVARLTKIPGVGKKTAERIGLELQDRLPDTGHEPTGDEEQSGTAGGDGDGDHGADVLSALLNLGYHHAAAERALAAARRSGAAGFEQTLRQALRELAR